MRVRVYLQHKHSGQFAAMQRKEAVPDWNSLLNYFKTGVISRILSKPELLQAWQ